MKIVVYGASGFLGSRIVKDLESNDSHVVIVGRQRLGPNSKEFPEIAGADVVINSAGLAHLPPNQAEGASSLFYDINHHGVDNLVAAISASSAKMLIHISSLAASGHTNSFEPISEADGIEPLSDYGKSKLLGETSVALLEESSKVGISLRPPLIYGDGARGNWPKICKLARSGLPLPFASVNNSRSYIALEHLSYTIRHLLDFADQPEKSGAYHVADSAPVSLSEIVSALRKGQRKGARMFPFPVGLMRPVLAAGLGKNAADGLFGNLVVDSTLLESTFEWRLERSTLEVMELL